MEFVSGLAAAEAIAAISSKMMACIADFMIDRRCNNIKWWIFKSHQNDQKATSSIERIDTAAAASYIRTLGEQEFGRVATKCHRELVVAPTDGNVKW